MNEIGQVRIACANGDHRWLEQLLVFSDNWDLVNTVFDSNSPRTSTLMHLALFYNNVKCLRVILYWPTFDLGRILPMPFNARSPMRLAIEHSNGNMDVIHELLKYDGLFHEQLLQCMLDIPTERLQILLENPQFDLFAHHRKYLYPPMYMYVSRYSQMNDPEQPLYTECFNLLFDRTIVAYMTKKFHRIFDVFKYLGHIPEVRRQKFYEMMEKHYKNNNSKYPLLQRSIALVANYPALGPLLLILHDNFNSRQRYRTINSLIIVLKSTVFKLIRLALKDRNAELMTCICNVLKSTNLKFADEFFTLGNFILRDRHPSVVEVLKILFCCLLDLNFSFNHSICMLFQYRYSLREVNLTIEAMMPFSTFNCEDYVIHRVMRPRYFLPRRVFHPAKRRMFSLKQLCRRKIRSIVYSGVQRNERAFVYGIMSLDLPVPLKNYLRFNSIYSHFI